MTITTIPSDYQADKDLLKDRVILVTGAGDGIGAAAAKTFAAHGATVILLGRTIHKLEAVYDAIQQQGYPEAIIMPMDLKGATQEHYQQLADAIDKAFGKLDGLLHNAGFLGALSPIEQQDTRLWFDVMQINLNAPFIMTQLLLPLLKKSNDASVIFTSSGVAHQGRAYWGAYGVSKAAGDNLMGILAEETENNTSIRVNSIDPGRVRTRMRALAYPGEDPNTLPTAEQIMSAYLYLMGPESKGQTGKIFKAQANMILD